MSLISAVTLAYDYPKHDGYHVDFNKDGSTRLSGGMTTERNIAARSWESSKDYQNASSWFNRTMSSAQGSLSNGAKVNGSVSVALENSVNKKSVMKGLLSNARKGGALLGKTTWQGIAFGLVAGALYDKANDMLFKWDDEYQDFVTDSAYVAKFDANNKIVRQVGLSAEQISIGLSSFKYKLENTCKSIATDFSNQSGEQVELKEFNSYGLFSHSCAYRSLESNTFYGVSININTSDKRAITQEEFDNIMIPIADPNPSEYVNASRDSQNAPLSGFSPVGHGLSSGATFNTGVYTDPHDGKAKQTNITVNPDGKSVTYSDTMRPDLDGDSESAPVPTPRPETDNDTETNPEVPTSASVPLQCDSDKYPDSLGCVDTSEEIKDASMVIPHETVPLDFQVKNYITSSSGTCPQGSQFTLNFFSSKSYEFSFEPVCKFAEMIKYALWVCSWLLAYFIIIGRPE